ncbi:MAG: hypothetical protein R3297_02190 [Desulfobulbales bacterium]|nr:hypothetical protein [Desulfobulbales bacterium]
MTQKAKKNIGIKDSISKLFILRDSCTGTCITHKDTPNIIWFEGAAVLLHQGVEKLKAAQHKIDSGDEDASKHFCDNVKGILSKLIVLKNSCRGVSLLDESEENINWYEGAESIICEVIDQLQKAIQISETGTDVAPAAGSGESKESAPAAAADESESVEKVEERESDADASEAEKQAAAG